MRKRKRKIIIQQINTCKFCEKAIYENESICDKCDLELSEIYEDIIHSYDCSLYYPTDIKIEEV